MFLDTFSAPFSKAFATNAVTSSFPSVGPSATEPSGNGVKMWGSGSVPNGLVLMPYGLGADNDGFSLRIYGWRQLGQDPNTFLFLPTLLVEITCVMCAVTGLAGRLIGTTERFCDTIAVVTGNEGVMVDVVSPGGDVPGHLIIDQKGAPGVQFTVDLTTGTPTSANCLYAEI